jgi:hypothetical protein
VPSNKPLANDDFLKRVRDYLPMDAAVWELDAAGQRARKVSQGDLADNTFYGVDAETMVAASHAIEDLALDEANGFLLASFQDIHNFESQRERYWQIAATIDEVQVIYGGTKPRRDGRVRFASMKGTALERYWVVLYQGRRAQALLLSRQTNVTTAVEEKTFAGFYSFDARIIASVRREVGQMLAQRQSQLSEYERLLACARAARQIQETFAREKAWLEAALRRWQAQPEPQQLRHFSADFDQSMQHFQELKQRLADALGLAASEAHHD